MVTKIVRDNCKDCTSRCEHAGKDREFVCVKGISCKIVKPRPEMVAVVRCKDCKHHEDEQPGAVWCPYYIGSWVENDFFCAYGERKADEQ